MADDARSLLDALAASCGVAVEYADIWGRTRRVGEESKRAILTAMGLRVSTDEELRRELAAREAASWTRRLPPVLVVRESHEAIEVPLVVDEAQVSEPLAAALETEDGARHEWSLVPRELEVRERHEVEGRRFARLALRLHPAPALGYHRLELRGGGTRSAMRLIVAPRRCHVPGSVAEGGRVWGPAVQLYALRGRRDWGIGDFGDLDDLVRTCGSEGAGVVGVNPLHALFAANPAHSSPYSPSTRAFLHWLYLDVERIEGFATCEPARRLLASPEFRARLAQERRRELIDHAGVASIKREMLETLYGHFRREHLLADTEHGRAFRAFVAERGAVLESFGIFEALEEHFRPQGKWGWPVWPEEYRRHDSPAVRRFADEHRERVELFQWLQWECDRQLGAVGRSCLELGLRLGLYQDLAVSVDRAGFEAWYWSDVFAIEAGIGAPPDAFNLLGQNWGLPPWIPDRLREAGYQPFVDCLRANMRHAGALRIDHVMGLMRAYWVPPGGAATEGTYVHYPFEDLLGVLALESARNRCLVVGEDLGTVPDAVRAALAPAGVLSYRLFYFMRGEDGSFAPPAAYPRQALVAASTHDLPTLAGWWQGRDLAVRAALGLFPEEGQREEQLAERGRDRARLLAALRREGLLEQDADQAPASFLEALTPELTVAVHRYLARCPSTVLTFQLEDVLGQTEQVNLPGTTDEHPNWRRRLTAELVALESDPRWRALTAALRDERGAGRVAGARKPEPGPSARRERCVVPSSTYRLQLHRGFSLSRAVELVPYLAELGVSHLYASPLLQARPGSRHGYDVIDHGSLNAELGSMDDLERLVAALREAGMGLVLDIVPNHMGVGSDSSWWVSVLEHGPASPFAPFFDIDWRPHKRELHGRVLLPILEDHYGRVLERAVLRLRFDADTGALQLAYHEHRLPLDPATWPRVLSLDLARLRARLGQDDPRLLELQSVIGALTHLPPRDETDPERRAARLRDAEVLRRQLARLAGECPEIDAFVRANVARFNGDAERPTSFDRLDQLLGEQAYRLAFWRAANEEINYRRFFDINDLAALRMEDPTAFEATHRLVLDLVRRGLVDGLRIDHPDGLHDPAGYFRRLTDELGGPAADGRPAVWVVAEKILASHERLRADHAVHGTTGYDFCNLLGGLFVDPAGRRVLDRAYHRFLGRRVDYEELARDSKRLILHTALASELTMLTDELNRVSESDRRTRDFTRDRLRRALAEVIAAFPVYRTYVGEGAVSDDDRRYVEWAVERARKGDRALDTSVYDFVRDVLLLDAAEGKDEDYRRAVTRFAGKFQQVSSPAMAKGLEDTAFYLYNRLLALNEVGGEPQRFGVSVAAFHRANRERAEQWPHAMLSTSTHDSKRNEDARARLAVLSEIPERWETAVRRWQAVNRRHRRRVEGQDAPSRNDEYALYQTLLAIWPASAPEADGLAGLRERVRGWAIKAVREAKRHSSWVEPDEAYEGGTLAFVDAILAEPDGPFLREFVPLARFVSGAGALGSLAQTVLKLTSPGVPDLYQGCELLEPTLVDPDNRRSVDFDRRRRMLETVGRQATAALYGDLTDGRAKLFVTRRLLRLRRSFETLFRDGAYRPLAVEGPHADRVVAFAREAGSERVVVVVPRTVAAWCAPDDGRFAPPPGAWGGTAVEAVGPLKDVLTHRTHEGRGPTTPVEQLLADFPVAVLGGAGIRS